VRKSTQTHTKNPHKPIQKNSAQTCTKNPQQTAQACTKKPTVRRSAGTSTGLAWKQPLHQQKQSTQKKPYTNLHKKLTVCRSAGNFTKNPQQATQTNPHKPTPKSPHQHRMPHIPLRLVIEYYTDSLVLIYVHSQSVRALRTYPTKLDVQEKA